MKGPSTSGSKIRGLNTAGLNMFGLKTFGERITGPKTVRPVPGEKINGDKANIPGFLKIVNRFTLFNSWKYNFHYLLKESIKILKSRKSTGPLIRALISPREH